MRMTNFVLIFLALMVALPIALTAQQVSGLTGVVTDSTGLPLAGVSVKLTNTLTGYTAETQTSDVGSYLFARVPPAERYAVMFSKESFATLTISDVSLGVGITETRSVRLEVGAVTQTIEVQAGGEASLNTTDASIGNVLDAARVRDLPTLLRNSPAAMIGYQPGVIANTGGGTNRDGTVTGSRTDQGNISIDGIDANDIATGQFAATIGNAPIDSVQELRTVSAIPGASEGTTSGAQIELVTKSGTNELHGALYEFHRNTITAANGFFNNSNNIPRPTLIRNQFGGALGEAIKKNKLFYFFNYEGRRDASQDQNLRTVPLDHVRNGSVAYINNGAGCTSGSRLNTTPSCITILTPAQVATLDPKGVGTDTALITFLNGRYPRANDLSKGDGINTGGFRFNSPFHRSDNTYVTRIDYNLTSKQKLFGRFNIVREQNTDDVNTDGQRFPGDPESGQIQQQDWTMAIGHTWTINSNMINQLTIGVSKSILNFPRTFRPTFPNNFTYGGVLTPGPNGTSNIGLTTPFPGFSSQFRQVPVPTYRDDFTLIHGKHNIQFGINLKPNKQVSTLLNDINTVTLGLGGSLNDLPSSLEPSDILNNSTATTNFASAYTLALGRVGSIASVFNYNPTGTALPLGTGSHRDFHYNDYEAYVGDSWRTATSLTLTYGVRWAYYGVPFEANGLETAPNLGLNDVFSARLQNSPNGVATAPNLVYNLAGKANNARGYYDPGLTNFGPRLGLAYNPSFSNGLLHHLFGDRKTVLRMGGAVLYDRETTTLTFITDQVSYLFNSSPAMLFGNADPATSLKNDPRFTSISALPATNTPPPITRPITPNVGSDGVAIGTSQNQNNYAIDPHFRTPYVYSFGMGIQRELPGNFIVEFDYVGRLGRKLFTEGDASQIVDFQDPASGQGMLAAFANVQAQLAAKTPINLITSQPWIENQVNAASLAATGKTCLMRFGLTCTRLAARNFGSSFTRGSATGVVRNLALQNPSLLLPNVGMAGQFFENAYVTNLGSSNYNGLLVSLRKRLSRGLVFDLNYTFSHSIDNNSSVFNTAFGGTVFDLRDPRAGRGNSDFDAKHVINGDWVYSLPFGRGTRFGGDARGWLDQIIGGWQVSGFVNWRTGFAFSTSSGGSPVTAAVTSPAMLVGSSSALATSLHTDKNGVQLFADPVAAQAALGFPLIGTSGNRNTLRGPGFFNTDMALLKSFRMPWSETHRLQFRVEAFNAFNHANFVEPSANIFTPGTFGVISVQRGSPRQMQFALRYDF